MSKFNFVHSTFKTISYFIYSHIHSKSSPLPFRLLGWSCGDDLQPPPYNWVKLTGLPHTDHHLNIRRQNRNTWQYARKSLGNHNYPLSGCPHSRRTGTGKRSSSDSVWARTWATHEHYIALEPSPMCPRCDTRLRFKRILTEPRITPFVSVSIFFPSWGLPYIPSSPTI